MANNLTNYGDNAVLNGTAMPATLYMKLHIGAPGKDAVANAAAYTTRISMTRTTATVNTCTSAADINTTVVAAAETITAVSFWDAIVAGNPWWQGDLAASKTLAIGDIFSILAANCVFTMA